MAHRSITNVKSHLEHWLIIEEGIKKYGLCPAIVEEITRFSFMNRMILSKHKNKNTRKDIAI